MASYVCITVLFLLICFCLPHGCICTSGIGLEFTLHPAERNVAPPGSVVHLSCSSNLHVDSIEWQLNHHPISPQHIIHANDKEIANYLEIFRDPIFLHSKQHKVNTADSSSIVQPNMRMMSSDQVQYEGKFLIWMMNDTSNLLVFVAQSEHDYVQQAGIYQCVASLGTIRLVSEPGRLDLAMFAACPLVPSQNISAVVGSAVLIPCGHPESVPDVLLSFAKDGVPLSTDGEKYEVTREGDLFLHSISTEDSGEYHCSVTNSVLRASRDCPFSHHLHVSYSSAIEVHAELISPKPFLTAVTEGENVTLRCATNRGVGNSIVWWTKASSKNNQSSAAHLHDYASMDLGRSSEEVILTTMEAGDGLLRLGQVTQRDSGQYVCHALEDDSSKLGVAVEIYVRAAPRVVSGLQALDAREGERLQVSCVFSGEPRPLQLWLSNGRLLQNGEQYTILPHGVLIIHSVSKRDAGVLQCFGHNLLGSASSQALLTVTPATVLTLQQEYSSSNESFSSVEHEHQSEASKAIARYTSSEAIHPSRPTVTRVADDTVRLHWKPSPSPVRFYKVQYRVIPRNNDTSRERNLSPKAASTSADSTVALQEWSRLGSPSPRTPSGHEWRRWRTDDEHISADRNSTLVTGLTPGNAYKFRVTAVLATYEQRISSSSKRFLLLPQRPVQPPTQRPFITDARWLGGPSSREAELQWRYGDARSSNTDGFLINLRPVNSSLPFTKRRFLGGERRSIVLTDIPALEAKSGGVEVRVQAFNMAGPSPLSPPKVLPFNYRVTLPKRGEAASHSSLSQVTARGSRETDTNRRLPWLYGAEDSGEEAGKEELNSSSSSSDESGSYSNEGSYSDEGGKSLADDSDERRGASSSGLSNTHLLGLLVIVLLVLLAVVAVSYGLYTRREKRVPAGYEVPLEQLVATTNTDHVSCDAVPERRGPGLHHTSAEARFCELFRSEEYRADVTKPAASLSQPD